MKRVNWADRQPGDIFLACVPSDLGFAIKLAELGMHPDAPKDFVPSHAGIIGFDGTVVEAWLDIVHKQDSVACVNGDSKYTYYIKYLELWRPEQFKPEGLRSYIQDYGPEKYGVFNLIGFEWLTVVKFLTGKNTSNPVECSDKPGSRVCSQGAMTELGLYQAPLIAPAENWAATYAADEISLSDCDPLGLRMLFLQHEALGQSG